MRRDTKLPARIESAIVQAFNLTELYAGFHNIRDESGEIVDTLRIDAICVIQLMNYYWQPVTVVLTHKYIWSDDMVDETEMSHHCRGLLLIPAIPRPPLERDFLGANPLRTIDVQWPIPVLECLKNMNLLPDSPAPWELGGGNHDYIIHTYTQGGYSCQSYYGMPQGKNMREFYDALITTITQMAKAIDDREISALIDQGQPWINRI